MIKPLKILVFTLVLTLLFTSTSVIKANEVSPLLEEYSDIYSVNDISSNIIASPTVWTDFKDLKDLTKMLENSPTSIVLKLNDDLKIVGKNNELYDFFEVVDKIYKKIIPVFEISNVNQANALSKLLNKYNFVDYFVKSDNSKLFEIIKADNVMARQVLEIKTDKKFNDLDNLRDVLFKFNKTGSQVLLLDGDNYTKEAVEYFQKRGVFVVSGGSDSKVFLYKSLTKGINGMYVKGDYNNLLDIFKELPENTIIRKQFSIAHRGYHTYAAENTIESGNEALKLGAEIIELDLRFTKDLEVVVIHDDNTANVSQTNVSVKSLWSKLKEVKLTNALGVDMYIPLFSDYLDNFKDKDVVLFIEFKEQNDLLVERALELVKDKNMTENVFIISFNSKDLVKVKELLPEIGVGYLIGGMDYSSEEEYISKALNHVMPYSSKFNPSYSILNKKNLANLNARGLTVWPWTLNGDSVFGEFLRGSSGITTDSSNLSAKLPTNIKVDKIKNGSKYSYQSSLSLRNKELVSEKVEYKILSDPENVFLNITDFNDFEVESKNQAYLIGSLEYELSNGVKVTFLVDVWEIGDKGLKVLPLIIIGAVLVSGVLVSTIIIVNKKIKRRER